VATQCRTRERFEFQPKLAVDFEGGELTSEAGLLLLREFDRCLGLSESVAGAIEDERHPSYVKHPLAVLVRQRLYQIVAGYEDANDATALRLDPAMQVVAAREPGRELSSQPTLSRLENSVGWASIQRLQRLPLEWFARQGLEEIGAEEETIIDVDSTDDPTHGQQELSFFSAHYGGYIYHPLLIFEGTTGHLLGARLRPGDVAGSRQLLPMLKPIVSRLWKERPRGRIGLRADSAFCAPEVLDFAEMHVLEFAIGFGTNSKLRKRIRRSLHSAHRQFARTGQAVRRFVSFQYRAQRWWQARRIVAKIEVTSMGENVRFVVTNREGPAEQVWHWYCQRGTAENYIKALKRGMKADRLSCHAYRANAFRLQLYALSYAMLNLFRRRALKNTALATAEPDTIRLRLFRVAARVRRTARRIWFHIATGWPGQGLFERVRAAILQLAPAP
jgi:hypothetical protein